MHYLSCCRYILNIFWAFQTACSGLKFSIQSYCLLFFLSSLPQNQCVDSLNSLQQATYHIYITSSHCPSSPISVSLATEEESQLQLLHEVVATLGHLLHTPTYSHRVSRGENPEQTHVFEGTYAWGTCTTCPSVVGVTGCVCVIFIGELSISHFSQALGLMNGSELLLGHGTKKWWGGTHPLVPAPCHLMASLQIDRWIKFPLSASTVLDPRDRKVCLNYLRSCLVSTEVFLLAYFEVFCHAS